MRRAQGYSGDVDGHVAVSLIFSVRVPTGPLVLNQSTRRAISPRSGPLGRWAAPRPPSSMYQIGKIKEAAVPPTSTNVPRVRRPPRGGLLYFSARSGKPELILESIKSAS